MSRVLYPVRLNGIDLCVLDDRIRVTDVKEQAPKIKVTTKQTMSQNGMRVMRRELTSRSFIISFVLWERDKAQRVELLQKVVDWADSGGVLTVGSRDGYQIDVLCDKLPEYSGKEWTKEMTLTLTAYHPYWRGIDPATALLNTAAGIASTTGIIPRGTAQTAFLEFTIINKADAAMTSANISVNGRAFALSGFTLAKNKALEAVYNDHILSISADGTSILNKRSADSADDLVLNQRQNNEVSVTTNRAAMVTLRVWEQWV